MHMYTHIRTRCEHCEVTYKSLTSSILYFKKRGMKRETTRSKRNGGRGRRRRTTLFTHPKFGAAELVHCLIFHTDTFNRPAKASRTAGRTYIILCFAKRNKYAAPHHQKRKSFLFSARKSFSRVLVQHQRFTLLRQRRCKALTTTEGMSEFVGRSLPLATRAHRPPDCSSSLLRRHTSAFGNFVGRDAQNCRTILQASPSFPCRAVHQCGLSPCPSEHA